MKIALVGWDSSTLRLPLLYEILRYAQNDKGVGWDSSLRSKMTKGLENDKRTREWQKDSRMTKTKNTHQNENLLRVYYHKSK